MKKIFAIALALVMVLSMASAFAMNCLNIDWSAAATACGTGSVEVVQYVKGNAANGMNKYVESDCAAAVNNDFVYYGVKVTVDANPNTEWWQNAKLTVSYADGIGAADDVLNAPYLYQSLVAAGKDTTTLEAGVYYLDMDWNNGVASRFEFSDTFNKDKHVMWVGVADVTDGVEVCAKIESSAKAKDAEIEINGAKVKINESTTTNNYNITVDGVAFTYDKTTGEFKYAVVGTNKYYSFCDGKFFGDEGRTAEAACTNKDDYKAIADAMAAINITFGQKIKLATAQDKLLWSGKVSDCAKWNDDAYTVVSQNCEVMSIPKTGDASVLAWLF